MDKFILLINKKKVYVYEMIENKINLFRVKGHSSYNIDNSESSIKELSDYMLERLNYENFSSCKFSIIYNNIEPEIFSLFINEFVDCSSWEINDLTNILPDILLKSQSLLPGQDKVINYGKTKWIVSLSEESKVNVEKTNKKADIELSNEDILDYFSNDYSFVISVDKDELFFDYDLYVKDFNIEISYNNNKYKGKYSGYIKNEKPNGIGIFTSKDFNLENYKGIRYKGEWENGLFNNFGLIIDKDMKIYAEFKKGVMTGKGISNNLKESSSTISEFKNGEIDGLTLGELSNGDKFAGEIKDRVFSGIKIVIQKDGYKEVGEYESNKPNGLSFIRRSNGEKFIGEFKSGSPEGICMMKNKKGDKTLYEFKDGDFEILKEKQNFKLDNIKEDVNKSLNKGINKFKSFLNKED